MVGSAFVRFLVWYLRAASGNTTIFFLLELKRKGLGCLLPCAIALRWRDKVDAKVALVVHHCV